MMHPPTRRSTLTANFATLTQQCLPGTPEQVTACARGKRARWSPPIRNNDIHLD